MTVVRAHARRGSHGVRTHLRRHVSVSEQSYDLRAKGIESDLSDTERSDLNAAILVLDRMDKVLADFERKTKKEASDYPKGSEPYARVEGRAQGIHASRALFESLQRGYL